MARYPIHSLIEGGNLSWAQSLFAPLMRAKGRKRQFVPSKLRNSEVFYRRRAERVRIAETGLRCFNNSSGNNFSYRIIAVTQFEDAKGAFIGCREPRDVIRPEHRFFQ